MARPSATFWYGRRVLITGHTGFKGAWLALWLSHLGATVSGLALRPATEPNLFTLAVEAERIPSVFADIRDLAAVKECFAAAKPEIVFHLAAQALVQPSLSDPVGTYATNIMGTVHLLEAIRLTPTVGAAIIVTSDKCYDNKEWDWAYRENEPMGGRDPYSSSKGSAELVTHAYRASYFGKQGGRVCRLATARAGNVIGGGDWSAYRLIPDLVRALAKREAAEIRNPGAVRPWQHVLDPLAGYIALAERLASPHGDEFAEGWNFGPREEEGWSVADIADRVAAIWGGNTGWQRTTREWPREANYLRIDSAKARRRLDWRGRLNLDQALAWTIGWYRGQLDGADAGKLCRDQIESYEQLRASAS